jgi:Chalcone isomerase-like
MFRTVRAVWSRQAAVVLVMLVFMLAGTPGQAAKLEGQRFDDTLRMADKTLVLNGLGLRGVAWIKAFVAGLYLPARSTDAAQILRMPGPKRLRLQMLMEASSQELSKAVRRGVSKNETPAAQQALADRVAQFNQSVDAVGTLHKGDALDVDYLPGQGTLLRFNGKAMGVPIPGDDFYQTLLKIFIGDRPVDSRLKEGLLRGR